VINVNYAKCTCDLYLFTLQDKIINIVIAIITAVIVGVSWCMLYIMECGTASIVINSQFDLKA